MASRFPNTAPELQTADEKTIAGELDETFEQADTYAEGEMLSSELEPQDPFSGRNRRAVLTGHECEALEGRFQLTLGQLRLRQRTQIIITRQRDEGARVTRQVGPPEDGDHAGRMRELPHVTPWAGAIRVLPLAASIAWNDADWPSTASASSDRCAACCPVAPPAENGTTMRTVWFG